MATLAEAIVGFITTLVEVTIEAIRNLFVAVCAISSERRREQLQKEWRSGWQGKFSLSLSAGFGLFVITAALYFWLVILA
jgi:hypothetical protein